MIEENGKLEFSEEFLRKIKHSLIAPYEKNKLNNTKCPNCNRVLTVFEALTESCTLDNGIYVPAFDESGVIIGECDDCNKRFTVSVLNPEFAELNGGARKIDYYFDKDEEIKKNSYSHLSAAIYKVKGDISLKRHYVDYIYDEFPLYVCDQCGANLETSAFNAFEKKFEKFKREHNNYVNWSLKNGHGQSPEYVVVKNDYKCSCENQCSGFFIKKYEETFDLEIERFSICNVIGAREINETISPGVYSKDNSVSWLYKLIPRWTLLFEKVYIITPFIGHQWLKSSELIKTWLELINRLDHKKSKILLKYGQFYNFKKAYSKENSESYERLSDFDLGADLLSELTQANDFHAKIYCGISKDYCEVFSGSANLVKGKSMEVMHFNKYDNFIKFNEAFLAPLGIEEYLDITSETHSLFFDSDKDFNLFKGKGEIDFAEYKKIILQNID